MTSAAPLNLAISQRLESFVTTRRSAALAWGDEAVDFVSAASGCLDGGKRLRGRFCAAGWSAATGSADDPPAPIVTACAALEVFQAAALAHDDIIDNSDTRRGRPSLHRRLEQHHAERGWIGDGDGFGRAGALLVGDLLLAWSDELIREAFTNTPDGGVRAEAEYRQMRSDVMIGQFLDIAEEAAWSTTPSSTHADRALRVATLKSARYSVEQPLAIGALLGGAGDELLRALKGFGEGVGIAFQLRDDLLGVFGDTRVTGKPAGDDLREGKRTVLIAYTRESASDAERARLDDLLGRADLTDDDVSWMQRVIRETGARDRVEAAIGDYADRAMSALRDEAIPEIARATLRTLADAAISRSA